MRLAAVLLIGLVAGCLGQSPPAPAPAAQPPACGGTWDSIWFDCGGNVPLRDIAEVPPQDLPIDWFCVDSIFVPVMAIGYEPDRDGAYRADLYSDLSGRFAIGVDWWTGADDAQHHLRVGLTVGGLQFQEDLWSPGNDGSLRAWLPFQAEVGAVDGLWGVMSSEFVAKEGNATLPGFRVAVHDDLRRIHYTYVERDDNGNETAAIVLPRKSFWVATNGTTYAPANGTNYSLGGADRDLMLNNNGAYARAWELWPAVSRKPVCTLSHEFGITVPPAAAAFGNSRP